MNWLAHLFLSEPLPAFRIGNLLPDIASPSAIQALAHDFQRGAACHREIDRFTDAHPVVRASIHRISPGFRRFGGVLVDLFYDHFLASRWSDYSDMPLTAFVSEIHTGFDFHYADLPPAISMRLAQMASENLLCSYSEMDGIRAALERIDARLRKSARLGDSIGELEQNYEAFAGDFAIFFPKLRMHVSGSPDSSGVL